MDADSGKPTVVASPGSAQAEAFTSILKQLKAELSID
jgi:hypothetical protein